MRRLGSWLLLAAVIPLAPGCTYFSHRGEDFLDMIDLGVTWSSEPRFALYYDFVPVIPVGFGSVRGTFVGLGGGRFGVMAHHEWSVGLILWGEEEVGFGEFDATDPETVRFQRSGLIGMVQGPFPGPDYLISCPHYVHLGWIGVVAGPRYLQMLDFVLGWTALDICFDDGRPRGRWGGKNVFGAGPPLEKKRPPEPLS